MRPHVSDEKTLQNLFGEIVKIRKLLEVMLSESLKEELEKIATTAERRRMWALFDGTLSTEEIARRVGVTQRAVQIAAREFQAKDWILIKRRGYPERRFDYIPSDWDV